MTFRKTIWMYWHQGEAAAPPLVAKCIQSWRDFNPDWQVRVLDADSVADVISLNESLDMSRTDIGLQHKADLIRISLLAEHGGVWADASIYCGKPLSDWLPDALQSGFFAFSNLRSDCFLSNWFLASTAGNPLVVEVRDQMFAFFAENRFPRQNRPIGKWLYHVFKFPFGLTTRTTRGWFHPATVRVLGIYPYFTQHYLFSRSLHGKVELAQIWDDTPKLPRLVPLTLKHSKKKGVPVEQTLQFIASGKATMHKLNWEVDVDSPYWQSIIAGLEDMKAKRVSPRS